VGCGGANFKFLQKTGGYGISCPQFNRREQAPALRYGKHFAGVHKKVGEGSPLPHNITIPPSCYAIHLPLHKGGIYGRLSFHYFKFLLANSNATRSCCAQKSRGGYYPPAQYVLYQYYYFKFFFANSNATRSSRRMESGVTLTYPLIVASVSTVKSPWLTWMQ